MLRYFVPFLIGAAALAQTPRTNVESGKRYPRIVIRGANHFLFSDDGALLKSQMVLGALRMFGVVGIEGRRQLAVTTYAVHTFFDRYLKGGGTTPLDLSSPLYPEIQNVE